MPKASCSRFWRAADAAGINPFVEIAAGRSYFRYEDAGAFVYGRRRTRKKADGREAYTMLPREQWILLPGVHPGYISWEQYAGPLKQAVGTLRPSPGLPSGEEFLVFRRAGRVPYMSRLSKPEIPG